MPVVGRDCAHLFQLSNNDWPERQHSATDLSRGGQRNYGAVHEERGSIMSNAKFSTVVLWVNVFIPDAKVSALGTCFRGDERSFDTSPGAKSRLHAQATISGIGTEGAALGATDVHCGETAKLDCDSGAILETATATPSGGFSNFHAGNTYPDLEGGVHDTASEAVTTLTLDVTASDPLVLVAPTVGADVFFTIDPINGKLRVQGKIDHWPCFEGYATADGGSPVMLFQVTPSASSDPFTLLQPRDLAIDVTVDIG
jgi:hypothetical protein